MLDIPFYHLHKCSGKDMENRKIKGIPLHIHLSLVYLSLVESPWSQGIRNLTFFPLESMYTYLKKTLAKLNDQWEWTYTTFYCLYLLIHLSVVYKYAVRMKNESLYVSNMNISRMFEWNWYNKIYSRISRSL